MIQSGDDPQVTPREYLFVFDETLPGKLVTADLIARFARPAVDKGGIDAVLQTYKRAGAREVLDYIINQINAARNPQQGATDEDQEQPPAAER